MVSLITFPRKKLKRLIIGRRGALPWRTETISLGVLSCGKTTAFGVAVDDIGQDGALELSGISVGRRGGNVPGSR